LYVADVSCTRRLADPTGRVNITAAFATPARNENVLIV
jgi:hypothetical protein